MAIRNKTPFHRLKVFRVLRVQVLVSMILLIACAVILGKVAAYSVLLGAMIALSANSYFMYMAFRYFGARSIPAIIQSFWKGEAGKMVLTAVFFALVFIAVKPLDIAMFFTGYILIQFTSVVTLFYSKNW